MENNKPNIDALLQKALGSTEFNEQPAPELVQQLRREQYPMKNKKPIKLSVLIAAVLIMALSVSVVYAAAPVIWRQLEVRFIQGEEFDFEMRVSEDGSITEMRIDADALQNAIGPVIIEVEGADGEMTVKILKDNLHLYNLEDAFALLKMENVLSPSWLPEGFEFKRATFPVNPIVHPNAHRVNEYVWLEFTNGTDTIGLEIHYSQPDTGGALSNVSPFQEEIMIGGHIAHVGPGILAIIIGDVEYVFRAGDVGETVIIDGIKHGVIDSFLTQEQLIKLAESLQ